MLRNLDFKDILIELKSSIFLDLAKRQSLLRPAVRGKFVNIKNLWTRKIKLKRISLHGLPKHRAKFFVKKTCPYYSCKSIRKNKNNSTKLYLYEDMCLNLKNDVNPTIKKMFKTMAIFQKWIGLKEFLKTHGVSHDGI